MASDMVGFKFQIGLRTAPIQPYALADLDVTSFRHVPPKPADLSLSTDSFMLERSENLTLTAFWTSHFSCSGCSTASDRSLNRFKQTFASESLAMIVDVGIQKLE